MAEFTTIARPYAKAAFEFAVEQVAEDKDAIVKWDAMLQNLAAVATDADMGKLIANPNVDTHVVVSIFEEVCAKVLTVEGRNFLKVIAENGRLQALLDIASMFAVLRAEHEKTVDVNVTSAITLDQTQQLKLSSALEKRLQRKVKLNCVVDRDIIGGLFIQAGDLVIDGTLRSKLSQLSGALHS